MEEEVEEEVEDVVRLLEEEERGLFAGGEEEVVVAALLASLSGLSGFSDGCCDTEGSCLTRVASRASVGGANDIFLIG